MFKRFRSRPSTTRSFLLFVALLAAAVAAFGALVLPRATTSAGEAAPADAPAAVLAGSRDSDEGDDCPYGDDEGGSRARITLRPAA